MTKGYIVVDRPESCKGCKFCDPYDAPERVWCDITRMCHEDFDKPDWCPIKEMPEKMEGTGDGDIELNNYADGRNELIDEMFGDEK